MSTSHNERLLSLDLFRGIILLLLLAEGTHLFYFLNAAAPDNSLPGTFFKQFLHAKWHGMHFWDLIQPYFTFIIGVAMTFSLKKRLQQGEGWFRILKHLLLRCIVLFLLGIMLQSIYRKELVWDLYNILTLFSISIFICFLVFRFSTVTQLVISFGLLLITEILYRYVTIEGFNQPFVKDHNFGAYIDMVLMGSLHHDGWVFFNCIPATAHMIWGVLTGALLRDKSSQAHKIRILTLACLVGLATGYGMDLLGISPINKKICTSSFMLASGGWCILSFVLLYWLVDVKGYKKFVNLFALVGMNSIFIYVFSRTVGRSFLNESVPVFTRGFMSQFSFSEGIMNFTTYMAILCIEWYLCYWLYKKRIFIKL